LADTRSKKGAGHGRRIYKNPPIHEAVCEFQFSDPENWTLAHSGLFLERVKKRYSGKPSEQRVFRIAMPPSRNAVQSFAEITKVQLRSERGNELVAVGPGILSIHSLKPYSGWEKFRDQIAEAFKEYRAIGSPGGIRRTGIRYINHILIPRERGTPEDFLTTPPQGIPGLDYAIDAFALRQEHSADNLTKAIIQIASIDSPPDTFGVALDIDVSRSWQGEGAKLQDAENHVDELRDQERQMFEALITEKARELFDA
jgi:uncharacterized protein (TIGR04255 family)